MNVIDIKTSLPFFLDRLNELKEPLEALRFILYVRDPRNGLGLRNLGRHGMKWFMLKYPKIFTDHIEKVPKYGRWDDLLYLIPPIFILVSIDYVKKNYLISKKLDLKNILKAQYSVTKLIEDTLKRDVKLMKEFKPVSLCAKWVPTENSSLDKKYSLVKYLCNFMKISPKKYRKNICSPLRKYIGIPETFMCEGKIKSLNISHEPYNFIQKNRKLLGSYFGKSSVEQILNMRQNKLYDDLVSINNKPLDNILWDKILFCNKNSKVKVHIFYNACPTMVTSPNSNLVVMVAYLLNSENVFPLIENSNKLNIPPSPNSFFDILHFYKTLEWTTDTFTENITNKIKSLEGLKIIISNKIYKTDSKYEKDTIYWNTSNKDKPTIVGNIVNGISPSIIEWLVNGASEPYETFSKNKILKMFPLNK